MIDIVNDESKHSNSERERQKLEGVRLAAAVALVTLAGVEDQWYGDDDEWEFHNMAQVILSPAGVRARSRLSGGWFTLQNDALTLMMPAFRAALVERGWENIDERKWAMPNSRNALTRADVQEDEPFQIAEGWQRRASIYPDEVRSVMRALREDVESARDRADAWDWATNWLSTCKNTIDIARNVLLKPQEWNGKLL